MTVASGPVEAGNRIGGRSPAAADGRTFESRNPAHNADIVGVFQHRDQTRAYPRD